MFSSPASSSSTFTIRPRCLFSMPGSTISFDVRYYQDAATNTNPYADVTVWVDLEGPGFSKRVYGFWDGGREFTVRVLATARGLGALIGPFVARALVGSEGTCALVLDAVLKDDPTGVFYRLTDNWLELSSRFLTKARGIREVKDAMSREILQELDAAGIDQANLHRCRCMAERL